MVSFLGGDFRMEVSPGKSMVPKGHCGVGWREGGWTCGAGA